MIFVTVAFFTLGGCAAGGSLDTSDKVCVQNAYWDSWVQELGNPPGLAPLNAKDRLNVLRGFNALQPITDDNPSEIYLILYTPENTIYVFFVEKPCVTRIEVFPRQVVDGWLSGKGA